MMYIYVSPFGNDSFDGSKDRPLATPEAAAKLIRETDEDEKDREFCVRFTPGEYSVKGISFDGCLSRITLEKDPEACGNEDGKVIFNGGVRLSPADFLPLSSDEKARLHGEAAEKVVRFSLRDLGLGPEDWGRINVIGTYTTAKKYDGGQCGPLWCELFVNGKRMDIARYPDEGFLQSGAAVRQGQCLGSLVSEQITNRDWEQLRNPERDIFEVDPDTAERIAGWKSTDGVWMFTYPKFSWADASTTIRRFDREKRQIESDYVSMFGLKDNFPYYFFNVFEELDRPGEWFLDRESGMLYLYPPEEKSFSEADISLSLMTGPILSAKNIDGFTVRGIEFCGTRGNAVELKGSGITVEDCVIRNVGGTGVLADGTGCRISGCEIAHTGGTGIGITGGDRAQLIPAGNEVVNNHIHHIGEIFRTYHPGISLHGIGVRCAHNLIHDASHQAMSFLGNEFLIEYNEIYRVCLYADDSAAIYSGRDYTTCGNIIRNNFFHDMRSSAESHYGIFGVYCDDNLGKTTITGNVFLRCQGGIFLHGGHEIDVSGNLIVSSFPESMYSIRFIAYSYWQELVGGVHAGRLAALPWDRGVWKEKYPRIGEYLTWDPENEQRYPHYCNLSDNIVVGHRPVEVDFEWADERYHDRVKRNLELSDCEGTVIREDGTLTVDNKKLTALDPYFLPLELEKMGLIKE